MGLKDQQTKIRERLKEARKAITDSMRETVEKVAIGKSVEKQVANLQKGIENSVKLILQALDVPTRKEINDLEKKIDSLAAKVNKLSGVAKKKPAKKKTAAKKSTARKKKK